MTASAEEIGTAICRSVAVLVGLLVNLDLVRLEFTLSAITFAPKPEIAPARFAVAGCIGVDLLLFAALWWGARWIGTAFMGSRAGPRDVAVSAALAFVSIYLLSMGSAWVLRSAILTTIVGPRARPASGLLTRLTFSRSEWATWYGFPELAVGALAALVCVYGINVLRWPEE